MVYLIWCHDGEIKVIFSRAPSAQNLFFFLEKEKPYGYMCWHDFPIISTTGYCSKTNFCSHLSIWKQRNNKVWNNIVETTQQIGTCAEAFLSSWKNAKDTRTQTTTPSTHTDIDKWTKANTGRFKCNVDEAFSTSLDKVGFEACIRDTDGNFVIGRTTWVQLPSLTHTIRNYPISLVEIVSWMRLSLTPME